MEGKTVEHKGIIFNKYRIAALTVVVNGECTLLDKMAKAYLVDGNLDTDIEIGLSNEDVFEMHKDFPYLTYDECAYIMAGNKFHYKLVFFDAFMLHASAVVVDGKAYLFSAPSGTGKSTHASLWCEVFGPDHARIINDDKPVIKRVGNQFFAYGTPWSGSSSINLNEYAPIQGIAFLEQSLSDWIIPLEPTNAIFPLLSQTYRSNNLVQMDLLLSLLNALIIGVPIYRMGCTISKKAVKTAYATMAKNLEVEPCIKIS